MEDQILKFLLNRPKLGVGVLSSAGQSIGSIGGKKKESEDNSIQAILLDFPELRHDILDASFLPYEDSIPREYIFKYDKKPTVIIAHIPNGSDMQKAIGSVTITNRESGIHVDDEMLYFFISRKSLAGQTNQSEDNVTGLSAKQFVNQINAGNIYESPHQMTPYQLGATMSLKEVTRQAAKQHWLELAEKLDSSVKWLTAGLLAVILFALIMRMSQ